ncbi:MAG: glycine cleavage protein (aminomethyl transferase) [Ramlibacter sp.]|nr:glycine cleavage protein (aminomethyl transferase) [Ramlibacter sp.]
MIIQGMSHTLHGVAPLPHLGVIRAQGEEAARFLHGQLTQDFALLGAGEARLAAFCNAKGRMLASFVAFRRGPDDILLVCSRDLLPATLKRLSMFVLRAKARLTDASGEFGVYGLAGDAVPAAARGRRSIRPSGPGATSAAGSPPSPPRWSKPSCRRC